MTSGAAAVSELFLFAGAAFSRLAEQTTVALETAEDQSGRLKWTSAELQMLRQCVARHGHSDLGRIAETLRTKSVHQIKAQIRRSQLLPARVKPPASASNPKSPTLSLSSSKRRSGGLSDAADSTVDEADDIEQLIGEPDVKLAKLEAAGVGQQQLDDVVSKDEPTTDQDDEDADADAVTPAPPPPPLAGVDADLETEAQILPTGDADM